MTSPRKHWAVFLLYTLLSSLLTWPLLRNISTHVPGNGIDDPSLAWNLWWIKHRLVNHLDFDVFHADWMFHPVDINLAFYTLTPLNGLISTPLQLVTSLIVSSNLVLLSSYIIGAYGAFLLCYSQLAQKVFRANRSSSNKTLIWWASIFGGMVYAFASAKLFYAALGQFNIASSHWVPFCILYLLRIHQREERAWRWRNVLLCALFLILQAWAELTYASFLIIFIVIYAAWILVAQLLTTNREKSALGRVDHPLASAPWVPRLFSTMRSFVYLAILFILGISPFLAAMVPDMVREGDFFGSGGGFADWFSADLVGYLVPTRLHPLVGEWVGELHQSGFSNDVGQHIYLGYGLLVLIVIGAIVMVRTEQGLSRRRSLSPSKVRAAANTQGAGTRTDFDSGQTLLVGGWFWLTNLVFFWLLTLGPNPRWFGQPFPIPGPFEFISRLPIFSGNRYPSRYVIMLLICAAVLAAHGLYWLLQRHRLRPRAGLVTLAVSALFLAEHLSIPLPLNQSTTPPIYQQIADAASDAPRDVNSDFTVLELPTGWRNGAYVLGKSDKLIMMQQWYQTIHGKRRLGGNTSRNPWYKFEYFVNAPLLGDLVALMNADQAHFEPVVDAQLESMIARSKEHTPTVFDFLGVEFVTVRVEKSPPALLDFVDKALPLVLVDEQQGIDWDGEPETIRLYRVDHQEASGGEEVGPEERVYELGGEFGALYLAEGWSSLVGPEKIRYALRQQVDLMLNLPQRTGTLEIDHLGSLLSAELNGQSLSLTEHTAGLDSSQTAKSILSVPDGLANKPVDRLTLHFDGETYLYSALVESPAGVGWPIGETGHYLTGNSAIVVMSAGAESGKFARIFVNGKNAISGNRGYNLVALSADGTLLDTAIFDTIADPSDSSRMTEWINQWPDGTIIAGAASDAVDTHEATMLTDQAVNALRTVGVGEELRGKHRWGHAFVGAVGAAPGSALETAQLIGVASVVLGSPVEGELAYGGVSEVRFFEE